MTTKPKLGQNFLIDPSASLAIVEALGDISAATVLEIGPGKGAITKLLAPRANRLIAVELDPSLAEQLRQQYALNDKVEVLEQDILATDLSALAAHEKLAVVGNLPYYITSQILLHLFEHHQAIDRAVIMVQREVADRIAAQPGTRDYGLLTATTQLYARVDNLFTLPPSAFAPPPDVHSTVLRLTFEPRYQQPRRRPRRIRRFPQAILRSEAQDPRQQPPLRWIQPRQQSRPPSTRRKSPPESAPKHSRSKPLPAYSWRSRNLPKLNERSPAPWSLRK